ncbi:terminase [Curtobacterium phage Penoan]|nr:terminase [Curtobacterium phage Penoan]
MLNVAALDAPDRALWDALGQATPTYCTQPTPGAQHDLERTRVVARALGRPHMPWQDLTVRIASERRADDPRQFRYKVVILTVPRQSGKTTVMGNVLTDRGLAQPRRRAFYTAQTGKDATERWKDLVNAAIATASPLRHVVRLRKAIGSQSLTLPTGSTIQPFSPKPTSLHGYTPHDVMVDEGFAFDEQQGSGLMGAIGPAQITLEDRQLWIVSTAGTADSVWLKQQVDAGRAAVDDPDSQIAYLEWSLPEGLDVDNPEHWTFHPAVGHTITLDDLQQMHEQFRDNPSEWRRAFMNLWTTTTDAVVDLDQFDTLAVEQTPPADTSGMVLAYEVARDRSRSAVYAAWHDEATGTPNIRALRVHDGDEWVAGFVHDTVDALGVRVVGADNGGPTRRITDRLNEDPSAPDVEALGTGDLTLAWDGLKTHIGRGTMRHDGGQALRDSLGATLERTLGQGWAPDRMKSPEPIPETIAATVALHLLESGPAIAPAPAFYFGG